MPQDRGAVVVIGATGTVGGSLCELFTADGRTVFAVGRDEQRLAAVSAKTGAHALQVDLTDLDAALSVAAALAMADVSLAVAAVGGWYVEEAGLALPMSRWESTLAQNLTAHFVAARAFAPIITADQPVYLAFNGIASHYPCEGSIAVSVTGAGQSMMLDVLAAEGSTGPLQYAELVVDTPILLPGQRHERDEPTHSISQVYDAVNALAAVPRNAGRVNRQHLG